MIRYCHFCGGAMPEEILRKSKKARFCKEACRFADLAERRAAKKALRRSQGKCPTCGRKRPQPKQEAPITRELEALQQ